MRAISAFAFFIVVFAATGCFEISEISHVPTPTPFPPDRTDCGEIMGTSFRSPDEQAWFTENCSDWAAATLGRVEPPPSQAQPGDNQPQPPEAQNQEQRPDDQNRERDDTERRCNEMHGRPYGDPGDREWFLQNCNGNNATADRQNENNNDDRDDDDGGRDEPSQGGDDNDDGDRSQPAAAEVWTQADCAGMRGRPYESEAQRAWYLANCQQQQPANAGPAIPSGIGPDGRGCAQIYGTRYLSDNERAWFNQNCPH